MSRYNDIVELEPDLNGAGLRIGIVMSRFSTDASEGLLSFCTDELRKCGVRTEDVLIVTVPGALEVSLALYKMATVGKFDALIALGTIIRGRTYQFEVLANEAAADIAAVQRDAHLPVAYALLTTDDDDQALERMHARGADAARSAIEMANLLKQLDQRR